MIRSGVITNVIIQANQDMRKAARGRQQKLEPVRGFQLDAPESI
jgi:hypothetical protein